MKLFYSEPTLCPMCGGKTKVSYSTSSKGMGYRRNRNCLDRKCGYKFRTIEILEEEAEIVKEKYSGNDNVEY